MTYSEAIKFLYRLQLFGAKLGLENTRRLAALTGNPHEQLQFIHVAGTNGKGSTCAMLESIYRHAGRRVGLFTSPHLISFRERIQINRELISEVEVEAQVEAMQELFKKLPQGAHPTFFEVVTIMALRYFAAQRCNLVIWETGLGGRLDATNIVTPLASVITNVDLDHQKWLGQTVEQIAAEKAGIIKPQIPVVTSAREPALTVIRRAATEHNSEVHVVVTEPIKEPPPGLPGSHQGLNAALAEATVRVLQPRIPVSAVAMRDGLKLVSWPGRLQMIRREGQTFLLDGAHNPAAALALREAIEELRPEHPRALVLAIMRDKDC
ncbi:MAG: bifunctional folylpolyglutamate synthase/dihydrofolate synthase, partial [Verrucomicrobia subdivision 3 bacterium]|nr:bifunctional folylpolyglutamate synthase/dihydrofolate synthase [Limisphaerales bacterium]